MNQAHASVSVFQMAINIADLLICSGKRKTPVQLQEHRVEYQHISNIYNIHVF